ncbi:hypothetical protein AB0M79_12135 [Polymorphospora sp. NPDC051019]|uniref:hypothetical protein n=1 Tax=Polymorphospora sp. NPDC051019 TaxID=3155725 RepID=UPI0034206230
MKIPLQRIDSLESEAARFHQRFELVDARLSYLTNAVGDLSQGQRELRLDIRELRQGMGQLRDQVAVLDGRVTALDGKVTVLDGKVDAVAVQVLAIARHLGIADGARPGG